MLPELPVLPSPDTIFPLRKAQTARVRPLAAWTSQPQAAEKSMPSSPEVWPHESLIAQDEYAKGRPEGTPKGSAATVMALIASGDVREAVAQLACPCPRPPSPARATGHSAPTAEGRLDTLPQPTHTLGSEALGGPRGNRYVELERPRGWRGRDPKLHTARVPVLEAATPATKPALRLQPRWCHGRLVKRLPPAQRPAPLPPRRTLRAPSTCRASLARVVTAP